MANRFKDILIPINLGLNRALDEIGLKNYSSALQDVYVDEEGIVHRRPGYEEFADTGEAAGIDGIVWWEDQSKVIVQCNGKTFEITDSNGTISGIDGDTFEIGTRVKYADFGSSIYGANGGKILQIPASGNVAEIADADAPVTVSHPVAMDTYLMGNEIGTNHFHYSEVGAPTNWPGDYVSAEAKPDDLIACIAENLELYLMCKSNMEVFFDDGSTPFVRQSQGFVNSGCIAPYSFTICGGVLYWMDDERNVVRMSPDSRVPQVISVTMNAYIQGFSTVSDAIGDYLHVGGRPYYLLSFPTEEKTLVWDIIGSRWYEWGFWNIGQAEYEHWKGNCVCLAKSWNMTLIGDRSTGKIYKLDPTIYDDDGSIIRSLIQTGNLDYGSARVKKISHALTIEAKRTNEVDDAAVVNMMLKYRDNGSSVWKNERTVALGQVGDTGYRSVLRRNGSFYSRQYQFVMSGDNPLSLVSVTDHVEFCT